MTGGSEREAIIEQLEGALEAEDGATKNVRIREAIQLLNIEKSLRATGDREDEMAE